VAIIVDGEVRFAEGYGVLSTKADTPVTADTVFSIGSVSKVVTAAISLKLHDDKRLSIDEPIGTYLTSWQIPETEIPNSGNITLRMVMSHSAGFSVHGFDDYMPGEAVPTIIQILNGQPPAKSPPVELILEPGSTYKYSGGGVTVEQTVLTDVLGKPFEDLARDIIFEPLGMQRSTFANPISPRHGNIASAHGYNGERAALPRGWPAMPEQAASGLWTSANDLGTFVATLIKSYRSPGQYLSMATAADMMKPVVYDSGLGPRIVTSAGELTFNHPGANDHYRAWIEGNLETGNGLVVLTNGANGNALMSEIRNAVSDTQGWRTNPQISLEDVVLSDEAKAALTRNYVLDRYDPSILRRWLGELRESGEAKGRLENGSLVLEGGERSVTLRLAKLPTGETRENR
jgi:CubicO group peptidase (beta-lactamase class C family)